MDALLWSLIVILSIGVLLLWIKIRLLQKAAREIKEAFANCIATDTNTLISISCRDRHMCALAESMNVQLSELHSKRHLFEQGDLAVKEAITNVSHDLRTPLTAICGYLELLEKEEKSESASRYLSIIQNRTDLLKQLTSELFCYSIATSNEWDSKEEPVILNHALEECILAQYASLKGCQITPKISMPKEKVIRKLNKYALSRIFENIISNAIKYSDGDLRITLSQDGTLVFSNHAARLTEVTVQQLFDRLYTVETGKRSTGLGLSIAKTLTEQMHGKISAQLKDDILSIRIVFP